uniref:Uncharacterized protein n=1 Tax=Cacopsylla melanoneura TaxID=428564 RepID=A0A8D9F1D4_9HEMI
MMKVTLVGLVIATVVDLSLGQGGIAPWTKESEQYLEKFKALNLPNPVCKVNTDCDKVKAVFLVILDAKYKGRNSISEDCSCTREQKCSCLTTFKPENGGDFQTYHEEVSQGANGVEAQYQTQ